MPDDETVEDEQFTHDVAEAATGRRWRVCLWMIALGIATVAVGVALDQDPLIWLGGIAVLVFALIAAGCTGLEMDTPSGLRAKIGLPKRFRSRSLVRKSGFPTHAQRADDPERSAQPPPKEPGA